jgi:hypothetical protein
LKHCAKKEVIFEEKEVRYEEREVRSEENKSDLGRKRSDLQGKGNICELYASIKVRIVKGLRYGIFLLYRSMISKMFVSRAWI